MLKRSKEWLFSCGGSINCYLTISILIDSLKMSQNLCVSTYFYSLFLCFSSCASFAYWYSVWSVSVFLSHVFVLERIMIMVAIRNAIIALLVLVLIMIMIRTIETYLHTHCDMSMSGLFFCWAPGQDMTVLDSRLYTWQEDLRLFGWFGVYWTDTNRMNCSAFGILYSGFFRYSECISKGVISRNSQTSIIDPSIFLAHHYAKLWFMRGWPPVHGITILHISTKFAVNPLGTPGWKLRMARAPDAFEAFLKAGLMPDVCT